jgi:hypothetical protein
MFLVSAVLLWCLFETLCWLASHILNYHMRVDLTETDVQAVDGGMSRGRGIWRRRWVWRHGHILRGGESQERRCGHSAARPRHVVEVPDELLRWGFQILSSCKYCNHDLKNIVIEYCLVVNIVIVI